MGCKAQLATQLLLVVGRVLLGLFLFVFLRPGLLPLAILLLALLQLLRLLIVFLLQLLNLLLMTLLQVLLALNINVALLQFLLLLGMFLLHTLALRILLLAQFILFALLLFRHSRIDAVRVGRAVSIRPHIFRRPVSVRPRGHVSGRAIARTVHLHFRAIVAPGVFAIVCAVVRAIVGRPVCIVVA